MKFEIGELRGSTVWTLYRMRDRIQIDPDYQRLGDIWTTDKRQLLIDTILNNFDIPKLYLHKFREPLKKGGKLYDYAIIDGKQRLETMWSFIDGNLSLDPDFEYFKDETIDAGDMTYAEIGKEYPDLKVQFDSFPLEVITIETGELEMIEEMFSRLNESAPLTAPEKRMAFGGPIPRAIKGLSSAKFFTTRVPFPNRRYRHFDLATKFLLIEREQKVVDTKKVYLDNFVKEYSEKSRSTMPKFLSAAEANVGRMAKVFTQHDPLLSQVGLVVLYYHLFRIADVDDWTGEIRRKKLADFEILRKANRKQAEQDIGKANYDLIEFDRYAQSPNDGYAIKFRLSILLREVFNKKVSTDDL